MTPLIDVIFLLLLFFMLTSTFSKFSEVELSASGAGGTTPPDVPPIFLQLMSEDLRLNGNSLPLSALPVSDLSTAEIGTPVLISLGDYVDAQRLTDLLVALRQLEGLKITVLGAS